MTSSPHIKGSVASILLILAGLFVYTQVCSFGLVIADDQGITDYATVNSSSLKTAFFNGFTKIPACNYYFYAPMSWLSYLFTAFFADNDISAHHTINLLAHLLSMLSLFGVLVLATKCFWESFFVALIFGVHPLNVETIALLCGRFYPLSALFCTLSLGAYVYYSRNRQFFSYLFCLVFYVLGLLSKPTTGYFFVSFILFDYWPLDRFYAVPPGRTRTTYFIRLLGEKTPFLFVFMIYLGLASRSHLVINAIPFGHLFTRIVNLPVGICNFIYRFFFPFSYNQIITDGALLPAWNILFCTILLVIITSMALKAGKHHPYFITGWLWFVCLIVPPILLRTNDIIDRHAYIPAIGLSVLCVWGVAALIKTSPRIKTPIIISSWLVALALMVYCRFYTAQWENFSAIDACISTRNIRLDEATLLNLYGFLHGSGNHEKALEYCMKGLDNDPNNIRFNYFAGLSCMAIKKPPLALSYFNKVIYLKPDFAPAHVCLANLYENTDHTEEAITHYQAALRADPQLFRVHNNIAILLYRDGKIDESLYHLQQAISINPTYRDALDNLNILAAIEKQGTGASTQQNR
jgi:hypothetical protein